MTHPKTPYRAALRRGLALGMVLLAGWTLSLTVDFSPPSLTGLEEDPVLSVALLSSQLPGGTSPPQQALEGWPRLLLQQSSFLSAAEGAVLKARESSPQPDSPSGTAPETEPEPDSGSSEPQDSPSGSQEEVPNPPEPDSPDSDVTILEMTARGKTSGKYLFAENVYLYNRSNLSLDASVATAGTVDVPLGDGPQILIYHSHGSEAYAQTDGETYQESDPYRTTDCTHNVVRIGSELATVFRAHGFQVIHDTTLFDYPYYNGAYDRSKAAMEQWMEKYPTICLALDVHRDALVGSNGEVYKLVSTEAGVKVAQVMTVVGSDGGGLSHPRWKDNLALAIRLQQNLTRGYTDLARPIVIRNSRYNQQLLPGALLVEFGGHGNTLTEALAAARLWGDNVARTLTSLKDSS